MVQQRQARATSSGEGTWLALAVAAVAAAVVGGGWVSATLAAHLSGATGPVGGPIRYVADVAKGRQHWAPQATAYAVAIGAAALVVFALVLTAVVRAGRRRLRPDRAARYLARGRDLEHLRTGGARAKAAKLGVTASAPTDVAGKNRNKKPMVSAGVPFGRTVPGRLPLFSSWEDMLLLVAGPRTMKTTAYAIPACLAAPGACLFTSNKRDGLDVTRALRAQVGNVWVFDPQQVANEPVTWWWNPLTYIAAADPTTGRPRRDPATGHVAADEARAEKLAAQFSASAPGRDAGARRDAYFDGEAENLVALLLLAAACAELPITTVYTWLTQPTDDTPIEVLTEHGFALQEQALYALAHLPDKQREGVYGSARAFMGFLRHRSLMRWVTPPAVTGVGQFHPEHFATSTDTLYPLSKEGEGGAGPLVAALTVAVVDALEGRATASPGGRLPVPFLAVLDEAANICKFRRLEDYYSHFGSRGIIIFTFLQSWAQGEEVWGTRGMEKLWSASNVKLYGGGVDDDRFLRRISDLIGTYEHVASSESISKGTRSRTRSVQEKTILTVAQLRELPPGRAVAFASGTPAALIEPVQWFKGPHAAAITAAMASHDTAAASGGPALPVLTAGASTPGAGSPWNVGALDD